MKNYQDILSGLFVRFPSVQKAGFAPSSYKPGLEHMLEFDRRLGFPSSSFRSIHVAGTNGKGSVSSMIAAQLAATGLRIGLFTSPHLVDFRERMRIVSKDGATLISEEEVLDFIERSRADFDELDLSFFEITTGMAFDWFSRSGVDAAVIEVGLGGRLDSTNILTPELSVVTSIGLDHCALLGNTRAEIAAEKAGIFKPGVPALVWGRDSETEPIFERIASDVHCPLFFAEDFPAPEYEPARLDLKGDYQRLNVCTASAAMQLLGEETDVAVLERTAALTGFRGRWETLCESPKVICDIGHNPPALRLNFAQLSEMASAGRNLTLVYGIMADKALDDIIPLMPKGARYCFATPDTPRALPSEELLAHFRAAGRTERAEACPNVSAAIDAALSEAATEDIIYVGGSTFVVSDALEYDFCPACRN